MILDKNMEIDQFKIYSKIPFNFSLEHNGF